MTPKRWLFGTKDGTYSETPGLELARSAFLARVRHDSLVHQALIATRMSARVVTALSPIGVPLSEGRWELSLGELEPLMKLVVDLLAQGADGQLLLYLFGFGYWLVLMLLQERLATLARSFVRVRRRQTSYIIRSVLADRDELEALAREYCAHSFPADARPENAPEGGAEAAR